MIDNFSRQSLDVPMKNKVAQTITDEFSNTFQKSNRKTSQIETDDGKKFAKKNMYRVLKQSQK